MLSPCELLLLLPQQGTGTWRAVSVVIISIFVNMWTGVFYVSPPCSRGLGRRPISPFHWLKPGGDGRGL